jgi:hypothetical protein
MNNAKTAYLVITAAVVIGGEIASKGALVEVTEAEARDLLNRGRARVATAADGIPADADDPAGTDEGDGTEAAEQ